MWSGKMAARWRGRDVALNAGSGDFAARDTHDELVPGRCDVGDVELDSQSCMDHSILAIFDDAAAPSEDKSGGEEESATLLSALTEMLDSVEDVDGTLSPFDTLPDSQLLSQPDCRDSTVECPLANRLRPRSKSPNAPLPIRKNGDKVDKSKTESKSPPRWCKQQDRTKAEAEVEVFTSTSLVNLVRLMHTYCLKLHVEEDVESGERQKNPTLFSQEEVWRYERPSEESDEEINVVSDDEAAAPETRRDEAQAGGSPRGKLLKGVLLNGSSPRGKKRVSFGPVHVASFDPSADEGRSEEASGSAGGPASPPPGGGEPSLSGCDQPEALPRKAEAKARAKALSLQQYRQLRQERQPLVEKQGNYTTKWPSVPEPPKELTPILCLQGHRPSGCAPRPARPQSSSEQVSRHSADRTVTAPPHSGAKRPRVEPKAVPSPAKVTVLAESKGSPLKKRLSIDPPNPVLLPLPVPQTATPPADLPRAQPTLDTAHSQSSGTPAHTQPPAPAAESLGQDCTSRPQEAGSSAPSPAQPSAPASENEPEPPPPSSPPQPGRKAQTAAGIEAADLTSLLEQFEETQAKEERVKPAHAGTSKSTDPTGPEGPSALPQTPPMEPLKPVSTSEPPGTSPHRQTSTGSDIPEPLGTEIILSTQRDLPSRRKSLPTKAIQIIDPRPLPPKRALATISDPPAAFISPHVYLAISCEHDYCGGPVHHPPADVPQSGRAPRSKDELEAAAAPAAAEGQELPSPGEERPASRAAAQHVSEDLGTGTETTSPSMEKVSAPAEQSAPCTLPTPPPSPPIRGRDRVRYRRASPRSASSSRSSSCSSCSSSSSSSSSASPSPKRQKRRLQRSESSSCSSSRSPPPRRRWPCSRSRCSRSRSWSRSSSPSRSRSRSPSPPICRRQRRDVFKSRESRRLRREHEIRIQKLKAIDERRVVYVGRICRSMTHHELRERFSQFGEVECVSLHFRERGDHYAFVTFYNMDDAFAAIDNGSKLRRPNELPFDLCFGGRRQFCNSDYADLDANKDAEPTPPKSRFEDLDFDQLLKQAQRGLKS